MSIRLAEIRQTIDINVYALQTDNSVSFLIAYMVYCFDVIYECSEQIELHLALVGIKHGVIITVAIQIPVV